ncbi:uncharacterized protein LAJ45_03248 [Morchella importuna]|nr:uncharacterized protein LAJ45_03248 [Morchella importuna]KAH8152408.1 hypothetical protein LAJ45_03248 [Morchella importuna]
MVGLTLRSRDWVFGIRVERTVSYIYLTYWMKKMMFPVFARLTVALESARQQKTAEQEFDKSAKLTQKLNMHSIPPLHCTNSARTSPSSSKESESTRVSKVLEVAAVRDVIGSDENDRMNKPGFVTLSTKGLENMAKLQTLASILPLDIYVFQVQVVVETTTQSSAVSTLASPRPTAEDIVNRVDRASSTSQAEEPLEIVHPSSLEDPLRTIAARNSLPLPNPPNRQPMATASTIRETHSATASPPLHTQWNCAPVVRAVNELDDDVTTVPSLGSTEIQVPTRTLDHNRRNLSGSVEYGEDSLEYPHTMRSDSGGASRGDIVTETWPMNEGYTRNSPTTVLASSMPDGSPGPSPEPSLVSHANQPYRPLFQPPTPHLGRSIQVEQPWSPELQRPIGSEREAKFRDDFDKLAALGL